MEKLIRKLLLPALIGAAAGLFVIAAYLLLTPANQAPQNAGYAAAVRAASPAVVNIYSTSRRQPAICEQPRFREWCTRFDAAGRSQIQSSLGSGVVVHTDGYILTNHHVIRGADEILVMFTDGRTTTATLVGNDTETDLAVIRVPLTDLTPIRLGPSDAIEVGDVVLAIGNPFGIGQTVSAGIVSAKGRSGISDSPYDDFLQTDAAINPGNSGGALIDTAGRLIGINSMIFTRSGDSAGLGFAIPAQLSYRILQEIIETGQVTRGWLGVVLTSSPAADADIGLTITGVELGGPADRAGLKPGDVVLAANDQPAIDSTLISRAIAAAEPGDEIALTVTRNGREFAVHVTAGERPQL